MKAIENVTQEEVTAAIERVTGTPLSMHYMSPDLHQTIAERSADATSKQVLELIAQGVPQEVACAAGNHMILDLAFNLGLLAGREINQSGSFVEMMLGLGGFDDAAPDAGEPEHGDG